MDPVVITLSETSNFHFGFVFMGLALNGFKKTGLKMAQTHWIRTCFLTVLPLKGRQPASPDR